MDKQSEQATQIPSGVSPSQKFKTHEILKTYR